MGLIYTHTYATEFARQHYILVCFDFFWCIVLNDMSFSMLISCILTRFLFFFYLIKLIHQCCHIRAGILNHLVVGGNNHQCNFTITQYTQFVGLLHETVLSLEKCNLSVTIILDGLNLDLFTSHDFRYKFLGFFFK